MCHESHSAWVKLIEIDDEVVWDAFWPAAHGEPSPLAVDSMSLLCNHPTLFHAMCYASATIVDLLKGSVTFTNSPEIKMHKLEAIRLINQEIADKGEHVHEAVILSIVCLIREASDVLADETDNIVTDVEKISPFKVPLLPLQW